MKRARSKLLYLSGPIRGQRQWGYPAFDAAARELRKAGYRVISPPEMDRVFLHLHEFTPGLPRGLFRRIMRRDVAAICRCDGMALLKGWRKSHGAAVEVRVGRLLRDAGEGVEIKTVEEWLRGARRRKR